MIFCHNSDFQTNFFGNTQLNTIHNMINIQVIFEFIGNVKIKNSNFLIFRYKFKEITYKHHNSTGKRELIF
jgi:hypothetical protein